VFPSVDIYPHEQNRAKINLMGLGHLETWAWGVLHLDTTASSAESPENNCEDADRSTSDLLDLIGLSKQYHDDQRA